MAKPFISKIKQLLTFVRKQTKTETKQTNKENEMLTLQLGYTEYVLSNKDAMTLVDILSKAERYEKKYHAGVKDGDSQFTFHVWPHTEEFTLKTMSDDLYQMAKLAGKAEKT